MKKLCILKDAKFLHIDKEDSQLQNSLGEDVQADQNLCCWKVHFLTWQWHICTFPLVVQKQKLEYVKNESS